MPESGSGRVSEANHGRVEHLTPPWWFWMLFAVFVVSLAVAPLWGTSPSPSARPAAEFAPVIMAPALGGSELRWRHRGGTPLPRVPECPSVRRVGLWLTVAVGAVFLAIVVSAHDGHRGEAPALVGLASVPGVVGTLLMRRAMRADLEDGRVGVVPRPLTHDGDHSIPRHAPGDRVVWLGGTGSIHGASGWCNPASSSRTAPARG